MLVIEANPSQDGPFFVFNNMLYKQKDGKKVILPTLASVNII